MHGEQHLPGPFPATSSRRMLNPRVLSQMQSMPWRDNTCDGLTASCQFIMCAKRHPTWCVKSPFHGAANLPVVSRLLMAVM
jgi:hypothetical protein